jgi:class 3 adenylate cyclase
LKRHFKEVEASRACVRTTFIICILAFASVFFSQDTQNLVVAPIEKMVNIVKQLADDPLRKPELPDEDEDLTMEGQTKKKTGQLETTMLETTILKIGGLLRIGFGEAGAMIIGKNMASQGGELNIMQTGKYVEAVYGFVGIADFADLTECLLEEVLVFVNKIARIVHTSTNEWYGAANKNMGDSFFLIWTLPSAEVMAKMSSQREAFSKSASTEMDDFYGDEFDMSFLADSALLSSIKIVAEIRRASDLLAYSKHPKIIPKFGMSYRVSVTLGVHVGWSIEGAIGSDHKIDASYLSPHVNLCAALERVARRIYNTEIIISQTMAELLSENANRRCRLIDCAKIMSSIETLEIYTFDIHREVVTMAPDQHQVGAVIAPPDMSQAELAAKGMEAYWDFDQDVVMLQSDVSQTFLASWEQAYRLYVSGDWQVAAEVLNKISTNFPIFDGPTQAILHYILSFELMPPDDWSGFRIIRLPK